jgi:hypothetical protein
MLRLSLPGYVAMALTQAEEALLARDLAAHRGDADSVRDLEASTAGLACVALSRVVDEFRMPREVSFEGAATFLSDQAPPSDLTFADFLAQERSLLQLVGLSAELASKHLDGAVDLYASADVAIRDRSDAMRALDRARDAVCRTSDLLNRSRRDEAGRVNRRRKARLAVTALGGGLIAVANPFALPFLGPVAVGASVVLGSAAAGAVADLIAD